MKWTDMNFFFLTFWNHWNLFGVYENGQFWPEKKHISRREKNQEKWLCPSEKYSSYVTDSYTQILVLEVKILTKINLWFKTFSQPNRWGAVVKWKHSLTKIRCPTMAIGSNFNEKWSKRYWTSMPSDLIIQHFPCKTYLIRNISCRSTAILHIPNVQD